MSAFDGDISDFARFELFASLDPSAVRLLAMNAEGQRLRAGDVIFRRNETADGGYLLSAGSIALHREDYEGPAAKIIRPWALLGETALIAATHHPVTAIAREPTTLLKLSRATFLEVLEIYPGTAARVRGLFKTRLLALAKELRLGGDQ